MYVTHETRAAFPCFGRQNYPKGANAWVELNLRTWRHHNPDMDIRLLNDSNIRDWVPDMPPEFFRLPYDQCKSDVLYVAASLPTPAPCARGPPGPACLADSLR